MNTAFTDITVGRAGAFDHRSFSESTSARDLRTSRAREELLTRYASAHTPVNVSVDVTISTDMDSACAVDTDTLSAELPPGASIPNTSHADGESIDYLIFVTGKPPAIPLSKTPYDSQKVLDYAAQCAYILHEVGHLRYSDFPAYFDALSRITDSCSPQQTQLASSLFNLFEDGAIERAIRLDSTERAAQRQKLLNHFCRLINSPDEYSWGTALTTIINDFAVYDTGTARQLLDPAHTDHQFAGRADRTVIIELLSHIQDLTTTVLTEPSPRERYNHLSTFWNTYLDPLLADPDAPTQPQQQGQRRDSQENQQNGQQEATQSSQQTGQQSDDSQNQPQGASEQDDSTPSHNASQQKQPSQDANSSHNTDSEQAQATDQSQAAGDASDTAESSTNGAASTGDTAPDDRDGTEPASAPSAGSVEELAPSDQFPKDYARAAVAPDSNGSQSDDSPTGAEEASLDTDTLTNADTIPAPQPQHDADTTAEDITDSSSENHTETDTPHNVDSQTSPSNESPTNQDTNAGADATLPEASSQTAPQLRPQEAGNDHSSTTSQSEPATDSETPPDRNKSTPTSENSQQQADSDTSSSDPSPSDESSTSPVDQDKHSDPLSTAGNTESQADTQCTEQSTDTQPAEPSSTTNPSDSNKPSDSNQHSLDTFVTPNTSTGESQSPTSTPESTPSSNSPTDTESHADTSESPQSADHETPNSQSEMSSNGSTDHQGESDADEPSPSAEPSPADPSVPTSADGSVDIDSDDITSEVATVEAQEPAEELPAELSDELEDFAQALEELNTEATDSGGNGSSPATFDQDTLPVLPTNGDTAVETERWQSALDEYPYAGKALKQALTNTERDSRSRGRTAGRFDPGRATAYSVGKTTYFQQPARGESRKYVLMVVLDRSGSMRSHSGQGSRPIMQAEQAVATFSLAAEDIGIDVCVLDFYDGNVRVSSPLNVPIEQSGESLITGQATGGTPLADTLALARSRLKRESSRNLHPLMLIVTDGKPSDDDAYLAELQRARSQIKSVFGLTLAPSVDPHNPPERFAEQERRFDNHTFATTLSKEAIVEDLEDLTLQAKGL